MDQPTLIQTATRLWRFACRWDAPMRIAGRRQLRCLTGVLVILTLTLAACGANSAEEPTGAPATPTALPPTAEATAIWTAANGPESGGFAAYPSELNPEQIELSVNQGGGSYSYEQVSQATGSEADIDVQRLVKIRFESMQSTGIDTSAIQFQLVSWGDGNDFRWDVLPVDGNGNLQYWLQFEDETTGEWRWAEQPGFDSLMGDSTQVRWGRLEGGNWRVGLEQTTGTFLVPVQVENGEVVGWLNTQTGEFMSFAVEEVAATVEATVPPPTEAPATEAPPTATNELLVDLTSREGQVDRLAEVIGRVACTDGGVVCAEIKDAQGRVKETVELTEFDGRTPEQQFAQWLLDMMYQINETDPTNQSGMNPFADPEDPTAFERNLQEMLGRDPAEVRLLLPKVTGLIESSDAEWRYPHQIETEIMWVSPGQGISFSLEANYPDERVHPNTVFEPTDQDGLIYHTYGAYRFYVSESGRLVVVLHQFDHMDDRSGTNMRTDAQIQLVFLTRLLVAAAEAETYDPDLYDLIVRQTLNEFADIQYSGALQVIPMRLSVKTPQS